MKIVLYSDSHWCAYSSVIRTRGKKYTTRLENELNTFNWVEQLAVDNKCDAIFNLGDTFDQNFLKDEELTALRDIQWADVSHLFLVGNHEMGRADLEFSSVHFLQMCPRMSIIDKPSKFDIDENTELCFLPYMLESSDVKINDLFGDTTKNRYVFSHNDIAGVQMGSFLSVEGLDIEDISNNCTMFFNGHLHNTCYVRDNVLNVGNITGQNFSEDAFVYPHNCYILDTDTGSIETIENPYAFNFYKLDFRGRGENYINSHLMRLKNNAVVSITCDVSSQKQVEELVSSLDNIVISRVIVDRFKQEDDGVEDMIPSIDISVDHLKYFEEFVLSTIGTEQEIKDELGVILS